MPLFDSFLPLLKPKPQNIGDQAEQLALKFLKKQKLRLIEQNFNCRQGGIDLIMWDQKTLVFIEVRYRQFSTHGNALESVTIHKQRRIKLAAQHYLIQHQKYQKAPARFDVLAIQTELTEAAMTWVQGAFQ